MHSYRAVTALLDRVAPIPAELCETDLRVI